MQDAAGVLSTMSSSDLLMAFRISLNLVERIGEIIASSTNNAANYVKPVPLNGLDGINFTINNQDVRNDSTRTAKTAFNHSIALKNFSLPASALPSEHYRSRDQTNCSILHQSLPPSDHHREASMISDQSPSIGHSSTRFPKTETVNLCESEKDVERQSIEETDPTILDDKNEPQNLSKDDIAMKWSTLSSPSIQINASEDYEQSTVDTQSTKETLTSSVPHIATFSSSPGPSFVSEKTDKLNNLVEQCRFFTDGRRVYRCIYCSKIYEIKSSIRYHLKVVHLKMHLRASNLVCRNCGRRFTCISAINRHHTRCAAGLLGTSLAAFVPVTSTNS